MELKIDLPYVPEIGKNKMKGFANGHYYTKPSYKEAVSSIAEIVRAESYNKRYKWKKEKIWVNIFLQKPMLRCDVANLVDGIFDAIKVGIGIDDCYFSLSADWDYSKEIKPFIKLKLISSTCS